MRLFAAAALALLASGCNIVIEVSEGGIVVYDSGNQSCPAGETCTVAVTDFLFDDVFTAEANTGYEFVGWEARKRGLCGGSSAPCELSTTALPDNNAIRGLLGSDEEDFFLVAVFRRVEGDAGGGATSGNAMACFNPELFSQGTQARFRYRISSPTDPDLETDHEIMVVGESTFNGQQAIRTVTTLQEYFEGNLVDGEISAYAVVDEGSKEIRHIGNEFVASSGGLMITSTTTRDPYELFRFDLEAGESFTHSYRSVTEVSSPAFPPGFSQSDVSNLTEQITFLGVESVTVDAGTYSACKFESQTVSQSNPDVELTWLAVDTAVPIKQTSSNGSSFELLQGSTLNGSPL